MPVFFCLYIEMKNEYTVDTKTPFLFSAVQVDLTLIG